MKRRENLFPRRIEAKPLARPEAAGSHSTSAMGRRERARLGAALIASGALHCAILMIATSPIEKPGNTARPLMKVTLATVPALPVTDPQPQKTETLAPLPTVRSASNPATDSVGNDRAYRDAEKLSVPPALYSSPTPPPMPMPTSGMPEMVKVTIFLYISPQGRTDRIEIVSTPDIPEILKESLMSTFRGLPARPGEEDGRPVGSRLKIELSYGANLAGK